MTHDINNMIWAHKCHTLYSSFSTHDKVKLEHFISDFKISTCPASVLTSQGNKTSEVFMP